MKFSSGQILATRRAADAIPENVMRDALVRHLNGDWGDVSGADRRANNQALRTGERILSAYHAPDSTKFWIITEADRSVTTVLLPDEY